MTVYDCCNRDMFFASFGMCTRDLAKRGCRGLLEALLNKCGKCALC